MRPAQIVMAGALCRVDVRDARTGDATMVQRDARRRFNDQPLVIGEVVSQITSRSLSGVPPLSAWRGLLAISGMYLF